MIREIERFGEIWDVKKKVQKVQENESQEIGQVKIEKS